MLSPLYGSLGPLGRKYGGAAAAVSEYITDLVWAPYLDESTGTRVDPVSGYDLTPTGAVGSTASAMRNAAAVVSEAGGTYLRTASTVIDFTGGLTASIWVFPTAKHSGDYNPNYFFAKEHEYNYTGAFQIAMTAVDSANIVYFSGWVGNASAQTSQAHTYYAGKTWANFQNLWTHVCLVYDPVLQTTTIYINGVAGSSVGGALPGNVPNGASQPISLGYTTFGGSAQWTGAFDEPLIWTRALTPAQVVALFNAGTGLFHPDFEL